MIFAQLVEECRSLLEDEEYQAKADHAWSLSNAADKAGRQAWKDKAASKGSDGSHPSWSAARDAHEAARTAHREVQQHLMSKWKKEGAKPHHLDYRHGHHKEAAFSHEAGVHNYRDR
jgi:hypothetical protein